jgi:CheY-like chemotaxis protein
MPVSAGRLVLVVDDAADHLALCTHLLHSNGFRVVTAGSAEDALTLAARVLPDVVLMDLGLPVMDGLEATRRLKANPTTTHIPVVAVSGRPLDEALDDGAMAAGLDGFVGKPFDGPDLLDLIATFLDSRIRSDGKRPS